MSCHVDSDGTVYACMYIPGREEPIIPAVIHNQ